MTRPHGFRWRVAVLAVLALLSARPAAAPAASSLPGDHDDAGERLVQRMLAPTPVLEDLRFLCDRIGGRPTGSADCERSVDWFAARFQAAGADRVWTESFPMPRRWKERQSLLLVLRPEVLQFDAVAMPYSPGTPPDGLEAEVVDVGDGGESGFARAGNAVRGALVLVGSRVITSFEDLFDDYMRLPPIVERARAAGAAGLLMTGARSHRLPYRHAASFGDEAWFPMAILAREDGLRLARLLATGPVHARLHLRITTGPPFESRNVVAEIRGRDLPDEIVLAGAHLDSWDLGTGALDNGANCAMLLDIARQMAALGVRPRRTVRFALFTGEEQGMHGSLGYVRAHREDLERTAAVVVFDIGTGRITGFSLGGREDLRSYVKEALSPADAHRAFAHTADAYVGTDNFDFLLEGVPNLVANQAPANYMMNYHASSDTYDKVDIEAIKSNGATAAALLWGLAEATRRAPRLDRTAIQELIDDTGLAGQMEAFGLYEDWATGQRGRPE